MDLEYISHISLFYMNFWVLMSFLLLQPSKSLLQPRYFRSSSALQLGRKSLIDTSPFFGEEFSTSSKKSKVKSLAPNYRAKTENQSDYIKALKNEDYPLVFGLGPAGCGKTLFACVSAIHELNKGNINKIILTRPVVPVEEEDLGFLPGNLIRKMDPWTRPIFDIFLEFYQQREIEAMLHSGVIEISPLAYMRGRTFKRSFIIADEMQNSTPNQMMMLTTRIGERSKMVVTGDLKQSDKLQHNGLLDFSKKFKTYKTWGGEQSVSTGIHVVTMNETDVQRSPIVNEILRIYNVPKIDFHYIPVSGDLSKYLQKEPENNEDSAFTKESSDCTKESSECTEEKCETHKKKSKHPPPNNDAAMIPKGHEPKHTF